MQARLSKNSSELLGLEYHEQQQQKGKEGEKRKKKEEKEEETQADTEEKDMEGEEVKEEEEMEEAEGENRNNEAEERRYCAELRLTGSPILKRCASAPGSLVILKRSGKAVRAFRRLEGWEWSPRKASKEVIIVPKRPGKDN